MSTIQCGICGKLCEPDDETVECIECETSVHRKCAELGDWKGGVCGMCQQDNPVFYDVHSRTAGDQR